MNDAISILVIDDEKAIRDGCERALDKLGYRIDKAESGNRGIEILEKEHFDIVLLDLMMPGIDGFGVLKWIKENKPRIQVIVITGFATVSEAVNAMRHGAFDFVGKPFSPEYIRIVVSRAAENITLLAESEKLREEKALDLRTIAEEHSRLTTVLSSIVEAVLVMDREQRVVYCNPAAIRMLDLQTDPVVGKKLGESLDDPEVSAMVDEALVGGNVVAREFPPGAVSRLHLRAFCAPVRTPADRVLGTVTTFEDITVQKQIDTMKSDFVAMVAHELRAPLASIEQMIYASMTACDNQTEICSHTHERMTVRIRELLQLIENLLSLSKLESGRVDFDFDIVRGDLVLREVVDVLSPQAVKKSVSMVLHLSPGQWWISADPDYLRGAITNIVENAIKYTPGGGSVTITTQEEAGFARIRVTDTGIGISSEDLPLIFDRFFRAKSRATRKITGSGLGLSLVKKVVEAHRGYIEVDSTPGQGSTFTMGFPLATPPPTQ